MARGVNWDPELKKEILEDYFEGRKTAGELSELTGVPKKTITQWAYFRQKECREAGIDPPKRKVTAVNKGGAPKGNKNASGSKGPTGFQNAKKHGAYAAVVIGELSPNEQEVIDKTPETVEEQLYEQLDILTVREYRILKAIGQYSEDELYLRSKTIYGTEEGEEDEVYSTEWNRVELQLRLEHELTSVQKVILDILKTLQRMQEATEATAVIRVKKEELKIELLDARIEQLDAKTAKMLGNNLTLEDLSETDAIIYGEQDKQCETV